MGFDVGAPEAYGTLPGLDLVCAPHTLCPNTLLLLGDRHDLILGVIRCVSETGLIVVGFEWVGKWSWSVM